MLKDMSSQRNLYSILIHGALISFKINVQYPFAFPPEIFGLEIQNLSFLDIYLFPSVSGSLCTFSYPLGLSLWQKQRFSQPKEVTSTRSSLLPCANFVPDI